MLIGVIIRNKVKPGSVSGTSGHQHKQDPRKLKSNLKDPVGINSLTPSRLFCPCKLDPSPLSFVTLQASLCLQAFRHDKF